MPNATRYTVVVIGTGFGGTMTALPIAREFVNRNKGETILMLERGTWWTTPVGTVQDKERNTYDFLAAKGQPVQFWSTPNNFRGFIDIFTRCLRKKKNEDGLYDISLMGRRGALGIFGRQSDGVSVIRAAGVGGGSLVYSNITIRPPNFIFEDPIVDGVIELATAECLGCRRAQIRRFRVKVLPNTRFPAVIVCMTNGATGAMVRKMGPGIG